MMARRRGVRPEVIQFMQDISEKDYSFVCRSTPLPRWQEAQKSQTLREIWFEFCEEIGPVRLAVLLVFITCLSLCVAYYATNVVKQIDSGIPVQTSDGLFRQEL